MNRATTILLCLIFSIQAFNQTIVEDSINSIEIEPLNRIISDTPTRSEIKAVEQKFIELPNITSCIILLESNQLDSISKIAVLRRLEDIAEYFYRKDAPIIIVDYSSNSVEHARILNSEKVLEELIYISLGNSSIGNTNVTEGVACFNNKTRTLIDEIK